MTPMRLVRLAFLVSFSLLLAAAARAQSAHWEKADDPSELTLVFENCSPDGDPQLPAVNGVQFALTGRTTSTNIVNFTRTDSMLLTYRFRASTRDPFAIPAFEVRTDKGAIRVASVTIGARSTTISDAAAARLAPASLTVWSGEVFPITYTLDVIRRNFGSLGSNPDWNPSPLVAEEWSKPEVVEGVVNGEPRANIVYRSRAIAKAPGTPAIGGVTQLVNLQTGSTGFGIFQMPRVEQISVESNHPQIAVRALPSPMPAGFGGAVGQFKLVSKLVPDTAAVGEPVTWTLELSGTGNWPDVAGLPAREVSNDFQVVQPKAKRTPAEGKLFDATLSEDVVLVPSKAGSYVLAPVTFVFFDPKTGSYQKVSSPRTVLNITAPNAPKLFNPAPATTETPPPAPEVAAKPSTPPATPAAPAGIPRDPLPGSEIARSPLATGTLVAWVLAPFAGLLLFWAWLAIRRAQRTDPARARREARARLTATLAQIRAGSVRPQLLLAWQRDTAVLWQITHAAPPATALNDVAWAVLWADADCALYGAKPDLPPDWLARAEAALVGKRVPGFNPLRAFLPRNLMPFAALLLLALLPLAMTRADEAAVPTTTANPTVAYRSGDFATAEKSWRAALASVPTDWIARHNLSLALAQQDRAGEAAAQAAAAFVQNPANPSVRWHFALASEKANFIPAPLAAFLAPGPLQSLARLASPAGWQVELVTAAVAAALALGWMLANAYGHRSRVVAWSASGLFVLSALFAAAAILCRLEYGIAADSRAVVAWHTGTLRSIPTEADTAQKTTTLAAGSIAIVDKTYLGWTRLAFENGQTGWVRKDEVVPLWH